jgi:putative DNA primase/helicase
VLLTGEYNVVMTSNTKLRVRLEGDLEAWRRRLMMISFTKEVENPVPNFAKSILRAEASGILNHMLGGLAALRREGFALTHDQKARVEDLLGESDSVRTFVQTELNLDPEGDATTDEIVRAHDRYCQRHGWVARSPAVVEKEIHKAVQDLYGISARHDLLRGGTAKRGFSGFVVAPEPYESDAM